MQDNQFQGHLGQSKCVPIYFLFWVDATAVPRCLLDLKFNIRLATASKISMDVRSTWFNYFNLTFYISIQLSMWQRYIL